MTRRAVVNVSSIDFGSYPCINFMKTAVFSSAANAFPASIDADGYPTSAPSSNITYSIKLPAGYSGSWIIDWTGQVATGGAVGMQLDGGGASPRFTEIGTSGFVVGVNFQLQLTGTNGRAVFTINDPSQNTTINFAFVTTATPSSLSNVRFYRADQETNLLAGEIFNPDYVAQLTEISPRVMRFLDWSAGNSGAIMLYKYMAPATAFSYASEYFYPSAWAGTVSGTNTYTVGNSSDSNAAAYVDGEVVHGFVTNSSTGAATLNRNSLGAKPIVNLAADSSALFTVSSGRSTFVYNSALGSFIYKSEGLRPQVPPAVLCNLCNAISSDCWIPYPLLFADSAVQSLTSAVKSALNSGLSLYLECSNEVWNFGMPQTGLANNMGLALGFPGNSNENQFSYYGLRVRQGMAAATTTWSGRTASELKRVSAFQAYGDAATVNPYRLQGSDLFSSRSGITCTITIASPGKLQGFSIQNGNTVVFANNGDTLPTGLSFATTYYVVNASQTLGDGNLSLTPGGTAINTTGSQSGTHKATYTNLLYQSLVGVDYNTAPDRPIDYTDVLAYATYYEGAHTFAFQSNYTDNGAAAIATLLTAADDYATGVPASMASAIAWLDNDIRIAGGETLTDLLTNIYPRWETVRASYTSKTVACYEGGLQVVAPNSDTCNSIGISTAYTAKILNLIDAYKQNSLFLATAGKQFADQQTISANSLVAWYYFCAGGAPNQWSTHSADLYSTKLQSYYALKAFDATLVTAVPRLRLRLHG